MNEIYDEYKIDSKDRIYNLKPIMFILPSNDNELLEEYLELLEIDNLEKTYTYPKMDNPTELMRKEIEEVKPNIIIQIKEKFFDEHMFIRDKEEVTDELKDKIVDSLNEVFVNLHHHDEYSIRDGLNNVESLSELLKSRRQSFCCVSNHGSIGGWLKQYHTCKKNNIKPIFAAELYFNDFRGNEELDDSLNKISEEIDELKNEIKEMTYEGVKVASLKKGELEAQGIDKEEIKIMLLKNKEEKEKEKQRKEEFKKEKEEKKKSLETKKQEFDELKKKIGEQNKENRKNNHLLLIAKNMEGFYNLIRIHNDAQINGFYYYPRVNREAIMKWGKGIIGSSACLAGEISQLLLQDKWEEAKETYNFYKTYLDDFYLELVMIEMEEQVEVNKKIIKLAKEVNGKLICSLDSHYLKREDSETHDIIMLIKTGKTIHDKERNAEEVWQFQVKNLFYRNEESLRTYFEDGFVSKTFDENGKLIVKEIVPKDDIFTEEVFKEALRNTRKIALSVQEITLDASWKLPKIGENSNKELRENAYKGLTNRKLNDKIEYEERLKEELEVICSMGFADYFLVMEKIIKETKAKWGDCSVGIGRGSAGGSLVSYCLELTEIDPIEHCLLFERFLDSSRSGIQACNFED